MAQKTRAELATDISSNLPDNTTNSITPVLHREVVNNIVDSTLVLNSSNLQGGGTAVSGEFLKWNGSAWVSDAPIAGAGFPSATVDVSTVTGIVFSNGNAGTHYEVTGNVAETFTTATGLTSPAIWQVTNSNADLTTSITIAEGASCTSNFGGDIKVKPGVTATIIHQGGDRFVIQLSDDWEILDMGFIVRYDGAGAWSILNDTDHKPFYEAGITASCSIVAATTNLLKISFSTTDASKKIISGMLSPDEEIKGLAVGHKINVSATDASFEVHFGGLRMRCIDGALTWGGASWAWANYEGDVTPAFSTNTASQVVLTHTGEPGNLYVQGIRNSAATYWVKQIASVQSESMNMLIRDSAGATVTPTTGDRIFIHRDLYGRAENTDFDADDLVGVTASGNLWGTLKIQRSKY